MITSKTNRKVKYVRSLRRRPVRHREGRFAVEGVRLIEEMIGAGQEPALFFCTEAGVANPRAQALAEALASLDTEVLPVSEEVMAFMADTKTPQGVLAVVAFPRIEPVETELSLVLDGLRDPGNLGTILRTAEAAGVGEVVTLPGTVDVYSPKVVRGGMGAHFRLPILEDRSWGEMEEALEQQQILLADAAGGTLYDQVDWTVPTTLIVGGEAFGAGRKARRFAVERVTIPMQGSADSLNVAVATGVLLCEAARQRREASVAAEGDG